MITMVSKLLDGRHAMRESSEGGRAALRKDGKKPVALIPTASLCVAGVNPTRYNERGYARFFESRRFSDSLRYQTQSLCHDKIVTFFTRNGEQRVFRVGTHCVSDNALVAAL